MKEFMKSALFFKLIVIPIVLLGTAIVAIMIYLQTYGNKIVEKSAKNYTDKMLKSYVIPNHKTITTPYIHSNSLQYNHNHKVV